MSWPNPAAARRPPPPEPPTVETTYREAAAQAITEALLRDERVFLMGEDVGAYGGCYAVSMGLLAEFGPERIRDTPLSEAASPARASARRWWACARSSRS
jgi:2-oxoisovalerate dehydrogenase E1 component